MKENEQDLIRYFHIETGNDYYLHDSAEVICLKCLKRHIAAYVKGAMLKDMECPFCKEFGYIIKTGQEIFE